MNRQDYPLLRCCYTTRPTMTMQSKEDRSPTLDSFLVFLVFFSFVDVFYRWTHDTTKYLCRRHLSLFRADHQTSLCKSYLDFFFLFSSSELTDSVSSSSFSESSFAFFLSS